MASDCGLLEEAGFDLKLAATEALTNALKRAPPDAEVDVTLIGSRESIEVEVADRGAFSAVSRDGDESGRGIPLMLALVDEVQFLRTRSGTRVRVRKHLSSDGSA